MRAALALLPLALLLSCGKSNPASDPARLPTIPVTLPNGKTIRAELATAPADQQRGLMFRAELASDRGMLFVFPQPDRRPFWMFQTKIPLDILWLDASRSIVFLSANTPPCPSDRPEDCPNFGGGEVSQYVLELAAGAAAANGLKIGDRLRF